MIQRTKQSNTINDKFSDDRETFLAEVMGLAMHYVSNEHEPPSKWVFTSTYAREFSRAVLVAKTSM